MRKYIKIKKVSAQENFVEVQLPSSKSISNRFLVLQALANYSFSINSLSDADDTVVLKRALDKWKIYNSKKSFGELLTFDLGNSGTSLRFLTSFLSIQSGCFEIQCSERMKSRPVKDLVDSLKSLGADISYLEKPGYPPLKIKNSKIDTSPDINVDISNSSQFASSLLLISPFLKEDIKINLIGEKYSLPYVKMTVECLKMIGVDVIENENQFIVKPFRKSIKKTINIEADWSSASFFYQYVSSAKTNIILNNLTKSNLQGDSIISYYFEKMGIKTTFNDTNTLIEGGNNIERNLTLDFKNSPDLAVPTIFAAAKLKIIGRFSGLKNLMIKESDRLKNIENILANFSYDFRVINDDEAVLINSCKIIDTPQSFNEVSVDVEDDHRLFMSSALMSDKYTDVVINSADCFSKSFPNFLSQIKKLGFNSKIIEV